MNMAPPAREGLLSAALVVAATLAIASAPWALDARWLNFVFKPLATLALIVLAFGRGPAAAASRAEPNAGDAGARALRLEANALRAGLVMSLLGDVALMWPKEGFLPGLVCFLLAHLCYLYAFTRRERLGAWPAGFLVYAAAAALSLAYLMPGVPAPLSWPVAVYAGCLAAMAAQAAALWRRSQARAGWFALGGLLFMASDTLLATNRFAQPLPAASLWILVTYWGAQWCLVWGLAPRR